MKIIRLAIGLVVLTSGLVAQVPCGEELPYAASEFDQFGEAVALSPDWVFAGIPLHDEGPLLQSGAVAVFTRSDLTIAPTLLTAPSPQDQAQFGRAIAAEGSRLVVGCPEQDSSSGAVYVFEDTGAGWTVQTTGSVRK